MKVNIKNKENSNNTSQCSENIRMPFIGTSLYRAGPFPLVGNFGTPAVLESTAPPLPLPSQFSFTYRETLPLSPPCPSDLLLFFLFLLRSRSSFYRRIALLHRSPAPPGFCLTCFDRPADFRSIDPSRPWRVNSLSPQRVGTPPTL